MLVFRGCTIKINSIHGSVNFGFDHGKNVGFSPFVDYFFKVWESFHHPTIGVSIISKVGLTSRLPKYTTFLVPFGMPSMGNLIKQIPSPKKTPMMSSAKWEMSNERRSPGCFGYIGDDILPSVRSIKNYIISRIPQHIPTSSMYVTYLPTCDGFSW